MQISARLKNDAEQNDITLNTEGNLKKISMPVKSGSRGSAVNGGELLFLSLATCFCNDIYREASKRGMTIQSVDVGVTGEFGGEGESARNIRYEVVVEAPQHSVEEIRDLIRRVDQLAEVHNTLRQGATVSLKE